MSRDSFLEIERDIEYLKCILDKYGKTLSDCQNKASENNLKKRCDFIVCQIKSVFN